MRAVFTPYPFKEVFNTVFKRAFEKDIKNGHGREN